jgi:threonyl-tRNA synthetase
VAPDSSPPHPITLTLPDGATRRFEAPVTGTDVAGSIAKSLAKAALAIKVDGEVRDLSRLIEHDARVEIVTPASADGVTVIRHDAAHVLAEAIKELYPETQITIGPAIDTGFYYDVARDPPFTPEDLALIETRMREIVKRDEPITREVWARDDAIRHFEQIGEHYKAEIIRDLPESEPISLYLQGEFRDLCRGPHAPSTGRVGQAFKLTKLAGAYWRGDHRNAMLQRIYGTVWASQADLDQYLFQLEEAEKRDHRRLGRELDLFHLQEEAPGSVFWHPKGWVLYRILENFIRDRIRADGYVEVRTPQLVDSALFKASGHWDFYGDGMFKLAIDDGERWLGVKPMNCPLHVQIFKQGMKSYRDLPLRMAEFGCCHRNEASGAMHGLMRVRQFVQDDAHIFCTVDQISDESLRFCALLRTCYRALGFDVSRVRLADRPEVRAGTDETWDQAEAALALALERAGLPFDYNRGDGAFYGPKVEFYLKDAIGREWQCGTLQLDFVLPERLDASYIGEDGQRHRPVMLHRAILGSLERFIGILIEQYAGKLPLWLAPVQIVVATITSEADSYAREVQAACAATGLRVEIDLSNEKINFKVRHHSLAKVPVMLVVGQREAETRQVAIRRLGGRDQEIVALDAAVTRLTAEAAVSSVEE